MSSGLVNPEYKVGDRVIFTLDGAIGIVLGVREQKCHVLWEDYFVSWENFEYLSKDKAEGAV